LIITSDPFQPEDLETGEEHNLYDYQNKFAVGCPAVANVRRSALTVYAYGLMTVQLITDSFRMVDSAGSELTKQRYDGSFTGKLSKVEKYGSCGSSNNYIAPGDRFIIKSPGYGSWYANTDHHCRITFETKQDYTIVYKLLRAETYQKKREACKPTEMDHIAFYEGGCNNVFDDQNKSISANSRLKTICGKNRKMKYYSRISETSNEVCFNFVAKAENKDPKVGRTGRFYIEVRAMHKDQALNKKRKRRSITGKLYGPLGNIDSKFDVEGELDL